MDCESSPRRKKIKVNEEVLGEAWLAEEDTSKKRSSDATSSDPKRAKKEKTETEIDITVLKKNNFTPACKQVSCKSYYDYRERLNLITLPSCVHKFNCKHQKNGESIVGEMMNHEEEAVKIEVKSNGWTEAVEVCQICFKPDQYLAASVLKEIVEIMMNSHEDSFADYTMDALLERCQQTLENNFSTHPPCHTKSIRNCYKEFLTTPIDLKEKSFTNRKEFQCDKGIVKYCLNRLEYEISTESKDEALVDRTLIVPEEMKESVKGLHWQKEKMEIFELLERPERIRRLMLVLDSLIEIMQFDLAVWHSRHNNNLGNHIMRSNRPLMAQILWADNILYTGTVNHNCRQILKIFVHVIHLQYPEKYIQIMTLWFNVIVQTFYICENNSHQDYPNTGKYCAVFAKDLYKIIAELPYSSIVRVIERIQPSFMQHMIGTLHLQILLRTSEENIVKIFIDLLKRNKLDKFSINNSEIKLAKIERIKPVKTKRKNSIACLVKDMSKVQLESNEEEDLTNCPKLDKESFLEKIELDQKYIIHVLYITMEAYLDAYSFPHFQDTLDKLNEQLLKKGCGDSNSVTEHISYAVSEQFVKKYRSLVVSLTELCLMLNNLKHKDCLPEILYIFEGLGLLDI